jgi:hydroxymethylpyrimidine/phosphomethylpyrimidine kinase
MPALPDVPPRVLAVAASDSSGAAGLQADLKTFEARGVFGLSALTALTAQDSHRIHVVKFLEPEFVGQQIIAVLSDMGAHAVKTGLLLRAEVIAAVVEALHAASAWGVPLVVDPVLVAGDGRRLADDAALLAYRELLFPRALLITPNLHEAAILTGQPPNALHDLGAMHDAARELADGGSPYVLVKGGHFAGDADIVDVLYDRPQKTFHALRIARLPIDNPRGAGCTFASCVAAELGKGASVAEAVRIAQRYVAAALLGAAGWRLGGGRAALAHAVGRPPVPYA